MKAKLAIGIIVFILGTGVFYLSNKVFSLKSEIIILKDTIAKLELARKADAIAMQNMTNAYDMAIKQRVERYEALDDLDIDGDDDNFLDGLRLYTKKLASDSASASTFDAMQ